jgi:hypothetical protein
VAPRSISSTGKSPSFLVLWYPLTSKPGHNNCNSTGFDHTSSTNTSTGPYDAFSSKDHNQFIDPWSHSHSQAHPYATSQTVTNTNLGPGPSNRSSSPYPFSFSIPSDLAPPGRSNSVNLPRLDSNSNSNSNFEYNPSTSTDHTHFHQSQQEIQAQEHDWSLGLNHHDSHTNTNTNTSSGSGSLVTPDSMPLPKDFFS